MEIVLVLLVLFSIHVHAYFGRFQRPFTIMVDKFGVVGRNYFIRFVAYLL